MEMGRRREQRAADNEVLFRYVNETIAEAQPAGEDDDSPKEFFCECADDECRSRVKLTPREYERIHVSSDRFIVLPGHEDTEIERVEDHRTGYVVVEKHGEAAEEVEAKQPPP